MLIQLNSLGELAFFFVESCVLLLLLAQLGGGFEKSLEISLVTLVLEKINLSEKLVLLLLKLRDFLFELVGVHGVGAEALYVLMHGTELCLQISIDSHCVAHVFVSQELVWDLKGNQKASGICLAREVRQARKHPEEHVLEGLLLAVDHVAAELRVEVSWVAQHLKEAANALLCFVLSLLLQVHRLMCLVEVGEYLVHEFKQLKRRFIIKFYH